MRFRLGNWFYDFLQLAKDELNSADIALFLHGDPGQLNPALPIEEQVK